MRLSKIKLAGFKSFVDPVSIHLPSNLIGIVGPNGCGKSNVIDAVRWVLGESSAKQLRGDSMADVIFNGSNARKPVGHASIELVFDNQEGKLGGQYAGYPEISVKRLVSRDGQSQYFLNGTRCRRRDITDVFLGTGLGPRSYAIIEQGMISRLIEARPEDMRSFIEEAAGISKYKERRRETENRIGSTRENIARLDDLRTELAKQLEHLERQARAAERYQAFKQEERQAQAELIALRLRDQDHQAENERLQLLTAETSLEAALAEQRAAEAGIETRRARHAEANEQFNTVQARYYAAGAEISRIEQSLQHARDTRRQQQLALEQSEASAATLAEHMQGDTARIAELQAAQAEHEPRYHSAGEAAATANDTLMQAEARLQQWREDWQGQQRRAAELGKTCEVEQARISGIERHRDQLDEQRARLGEELAALEHLLTGADGTTLEAELAGCEHEVTTLGERRSALQEAIATARTTLAEAQRRLDAARATRQAQQARQASLEALQARALGLGDSALSAWLGQQGLDQAPRLAHGLTVTQGWERAVEAVLGASLQAVCISDLGQLQTALAHAAGTPALSVVDGSPVRDTSHRNTFAPLLDQVAGDTRLAGLFAGIYCAPDLATACNERHTLADHESFITADGTWLGANWLRRIPPPDAQEGVLERTREISELGSSIDVISNEISALETAFREAEGQLGGLENGREQCLAAQGEAQRRLAEARAALSAFTSTRGQQSARRDMLHAQVPEIERQLATDRAALDEAQTRLDAASREAQTLDGQGQALGAQQAQHQATLETARSVAQGARDALHALALRSEALKNQLEGIVGGLARLRDQHQQAQASCENLRAQLETGEAPLARLATELEAALTRRAEVEQALSSARNALEALDSELRELNEQRARHEQAVRAHRDTVEALRISWQAHAVRREGLLEQFAQTGLELAAVQAALPGQADEQQWLTQLERLAQRIQRLGPINLAAIEEQAQLAERKQYLDAQHADLADALETLENAIRKIDRETRARFQETYERVNEGFQTTFPRLFGGGQAYLELTGEDLLETGVSVMARPPGKRISTIHLMSGGEKALTAVALVFAIFELNPAPFCMLDEVDAPLDDANVGRFCEMVREMSERVQFVFITHNKTTMELAHQLTGVTMQEAGVSRLVAVDLDEAVRLATA
jgi:chromosome segregation protein